MFFSAACLSIPSDRSTPDEPCCKRRDERATQPSPASRVEHVEPVRGFEAAVLERRGNQRGRAVGQFCEFRLKLAAKLSKVV